jgi:uncharacterized coiled-coil DUF342 family protein
MENEQAIRDELNKVREDIRALKSQFLSSKDEKEKHFTKGEGHGKEIEGLLAEIKKIEEESHLDKINQELEARKKEYEEAKTELAKLPAFDAGAQQREVFAQPKQSVSSDAKFVKRISPQKAEKDIKKLELEMQTQVLSLDKEAEYTKKIDELKEIARQPVVQEKTDATQPLSGPAAQYRKAKKKQIIAEKAIRSLYKQIRLISKEKKKRYKIIDALRDEKKKAFEDFRNMKKDYTSHGKNLKSLYKQEEELLAQLGESPMQRKRVAEKNLKVKQKELEEKLMKKGGTLTTEDLLMLQSKK